MKPYRNLISDSLLITDTIALLHSFGGRASAVNIVDFVMKIRKPEPGIAKMLVSDLVERDPRLHLSDDMVELVGDGFEAKDLADTEFVVFDLETTGAKSPPCRITEIGAYRVRGGEITGEFQTLVNPETTIPPFITSLTGISDDMVKGAPRFCDIAADFLEFVGDAVLVAHNAPFDMGFLNDEISRIHDGYRVANPCLCTVQLSRRLLPNIENHRLKTLAEYYSVSLVNHHRAGEDARATAHIFVNLLTEMVSCGVRDLATVRSMGKRNFVYA